MSASDDPHSPGLNAPVSKPSADKARAHLARVYARAARFHPRAGARLAVVGVVNALWGMITTFVPVFAIIAAVTQIAAARPAIVDTFRYACATWLLSYRVPLRLDGYPVAMAPLLITAFAWWRAMRAGRHSVRAVKARGRRSWPVTGAVTALVAAPYALFGAGAAGLVNGIGVVVSPTRVALTLGCFAGAAAFLGAGAATGATRSLWRRVPPLLRDGARAGVMAGSLLLGAGALVTGVAIAVSGGAAADMLGGYHTGVVGQAALVLICLVYAPNVAVWATAFLAGPGFSLAAAPALPVFAGLPREPLTGAAQLLLATPLLAGVVGGLLLVRKPGAAARAARARHMALVAGVAGAVSGVLLAVAGRLAAGSLGVGLLAGIGQIGWQYPVVCGAGVACGSMLGVLGGRGAARRVKAGDA